MSKNLKKVCLDHLAPGKDEDEGQMKYRLANDGGEDEGDEKPEGDAPEESDDEGDDEEPEDTEAAALKVRLEELEAENERLRGDDEPFEEKLERERKRTESLAGENKRLAMKITRSEIIKQYPDVDPSFIIGDNKKDMLASAKRQKAMIDGIRSKYKEEVMAEVKKEMGEPVIEGSGGTAKVPDDIGKQIAEAQAKGDIKEVSRLVALRGLVKFRKS